MKIYLASQYGRRKELCEYRAQLRNRGHEITSRWLDGPKQLDRGSAIGDSTETLVESGSGPEADRLRAQFAAHNSEDIRRADLLIAFTEPPDPGPGAGRGGRHVELGMAIAWDKSICVIGYRENIFCHLFGVAFFDDWNDCLRNSVLAEVPQS